MHQPSRQWVPTDSGSYLTIVVVDDDAGEAIQLELFDLDDLADAIPDPTAGQYFMG